jgi:hypothetical protein
MSDVASISNLVQTNVAHEVSMRVAVKAKDVAKQQGAAAVSLLESAAELSQNLSKAIGKGMKLDVVG